MSSGGIRHAPNARDRQGPTETATNAMTLNALVQTLFQGMSL